MTVRNNHKTSRHRKPWRNLHHKTNPHPAKKHLELLQAVVSFRQQQGAKA